MAFETGLERSRRVFQLCAEAQVEPRERSRRVIPAEKQEKASRREVLGSESRKVVWA